MMGPKRLESWALGRPGIRRGLVSGRSGRQPGHSRASGCLLIYGRSSGRQLCPRPRCCRGACRHAAAGAIADIIQQVEQRGDAQGCHLCNAWAGGTPGCNE